MRLARPILITAVGEMGASAGEQLTRELPPIDDLEVAVWTQTPSSDEIASLASAAFARPTAALADRLAWVHLTEASEDFAPLIAAATALRADGRPFTLTLLLGDASEGRQSAHAARLRELSVAIEGALLESTTQVYLLRRRLSNGFVLPYEEVASYLAIAARGLTFTNAVGLPDDLAPSLLVPTPNDLLTTGEESGKRVFGRLGVIRLRSPITAAAGRCADLVMARFANAALDRKQKIEVGWTVPPVVIAPPGVAAPAKKQIASQLRAGPGLRLPRPPSLRRDWADDAARLRQESRVWTDAFDAWSRDVRVAFVDILREVRDNAARATQDGIHRVNATATTIWQNRDLGAPTRHVREAMRRQIRVWDEDTQRTDRTARRANRADTITEIEGLTRKLTSQLRTRPNARLMAIYSMVAIVLAGIASQAIIGALDPTNLPLPPVLDVDAPTKIALWRVTAAVSVPIAVLFVVGTSLFRTRLRFDRAFTALRMAMSSLLRKSTDDLNHEIDLADEHWHQKSINQARRQAAKIANRMDDIERELRSFAFVDAPGASTKRSFDRLVPDSPQALQAEVEESVARELEASGIARSALFADSAITGTNVWSPVVREALIERGQAQLRDQFGAPSGSGRQSLERTGKEWLKASPHFLAKPAPGQSARPERLRFALAQSSLGEIATPQDGFGEIHVLPGDQDELLGLVAQMGLSPDGVSR